ncbi:biopolymer transporter ExbD [Flavobacteriales bacterium]|nr:biopolymer transporter ExbD [Flavobacteriales bacterium]
MALKSRNKVSASFNMSSMTDIVFLLLIFFMLTSTLVSQNVLEALSYSDSEDQKKEDNINLHINKEAEYYFRKSNESKEFIEEKDLEEILKNKFLEIEEPGITLYIDKMAPVYHAIDVMSIAQRNKYKFEFGTERPPKE